MPYPRAETPDDRRADQFMVACVFLAITVILTIGIWNEITCPYPITRTAVLELAR